MVKGFKVFNPDWSCMNKKYTCPGYFEEDVIPRVCSAGMHFCKKAADCFNYYSFNPNNHVCEVIAHGDIEENNDKCCTNKLEIVREIPWAEVLEIVNAGKACTGLCNSGNRNSGDWNSGDCNSGDWNSGNRNSGNRNSGNRNSGNRNSGDWNKTRFSNGCFNTVEPKIYLFNKPSDWTFADWRNSKACYLLDHIPFDMLVYRYFDDMTDEEKAQHPEAKTTGGYLKMAKPKENAQHWYNGLDDEDKQVIKSIPNFDAKIFEEITGIKVD